MSLALVVMKMLKHAQSALCFSDGDDTNVLNRGPSGRRLRFGEEKANMNALYRKPVNACEGYDFQIVSNLRLFERLR